MYRFCLIDGLRLPLFLVAILLFSASIVIGQEGVKKNAKKETLSIQDLYVVSGYMGDGEYGTKYVSFDGAWDSLPGSKPTCIRVVYTFGPVRWAGIYMQNKPDNWGDVPGEDYSKKGFSKVTFLAKGETGKKVVEFKSGGIHDPNKPFHDSHSLSTGRLSLSQEWKRFEINLEKADLSSVIGGFCWVAAKEFNRSERVIFYIDDIIFE